MNNKYKIMIVVAAIILSIIALPFILQSSAKFLVIQDKLQKADVILVLAGDSNGERVSQAAKLYHGKWAPKILMSGGPAVWNLTYAQNMRNQAKYLGVPEKDILIQDLSESTYEDLKYSLEIIRKLNAKNIILVSSPYHMRRMVLSARKMYKPYKIKIIAYPAQKSKWESNRWWTRHEDTQPVIYEYLALIQYLLKGWLL